MEDKLYKAYLFQHEIEMIRKLVTNVLDSTNDEEESSILLSILDSMDSVSEEKLNLDPDYKIID